MHTQVPHSSDLLNNTAIPLAVVVAPMALPDPADDPIQVGGRWLVGVHVMVMLCWAF